MSLIPWSRRDIIPTQFRTLRDELDEFFSPLFESVPSYGTGQLRTFIPLVDVREDEQNVTVTAELPGVDKQDVDIQIDGEVLTIRGERREEHTFSSHPQAGGQGQQGQAASQGQGQSGMTTGQGQQGQQSQGQQGQQSRVQPTSRGQSAAPSSRAAASGRIEASGRGDNWWRREISYGAFVRRITLPCEVDPSKTEAGMQNGVLTIQMAKASGSRSKSIKIQ